MIKATLNRTSLNSLATGCAALTLALATVPAAAQEAGRTRVGTLTCASWRPLSFRTGELRPLDALYQSNRPQRGGARSPVPLTPAWAGCGEWGLGPATKVTRHDTHTRHLAL